MKRVLWVVLAAVCVVVTKSLLVEAQGAQARPAAQSAPAAQPARAWYSVNIVTVKRDSVPQWAEFQKTQTIPMQQKGGVKQRDTWQSGAPFGDGNTYAIVTPIDKFEDYDKPPLAARMLQGDALRAYQQKTAALTASNHMFAIQDRAELSMIPASSAKIKGGILTDITVLPGHEAQYEAYIKNEVLPTLKKGNVAGYLVSRTVFGGNAGEYHTLQLFESYGEIDKGPVPTRVLGQAAAQAMTAKVIPHISAVNRTIVRYVPELSYARKPTT
jgi:hypothetical protein